MFHHRYLPWDYGVRNLLRRPLRNALTLAAMVTVILLVLVVVGFIRGLERSLAASGDPDVVLVYSLGAEENIENSVVAGRIPGLLAASLDGVQRRYGVPHVSGELYLGTRINNDRDQSTLGLVRGVTTMSPLVRRSVRITEGRWPRNGEVLVGRLAAAKLGWDATDLKIGNNIQFERTSWRIGGHFTSGGSVFDAEIWCPLADFQRVLKRQDLSSVAILLAPGARAADVELFCKERTDLELQAISETDYYALLQRHYRPVRLLAWLIVSLVSSAGVFAGMNMMFGAVVGRVREIAALQAIGYRRRAVLISLVQEGTLIAMTAALIASAIAMLLIHGAAVRFTMGAFTLRIDGFCLLVGCITGLIVGVLGSIPPALRVLRLPIAEGLRAV
jgi:ABC-type lipoprotein release transport system permease subunit